MCEERLDRALVSRGLVSSREKAQRLIEGGFVTVDARVEKRAKKTVQSSAQLAVLAQERYVSRGGYKLESALKEFHLSVQGLDCLDVGASTGGFTDCLLQHGAASVLAVDVGHDQLAPSLKNDVRVESWEGVNVRTWADEGGVNPELRERFNLIVVDVSFISLQLVVPGLLHLAAAGAVMILLVKPQFEVGRGKIGKGGIVKDEQARLESLDATKSLLSSARGWNVVGTMECPVEGKAGNREYLLCAKKSSK
jgi:23S rRNA (cytidine1920-2'-O)/16S rRNA (cytidine1409-2'-O)-methyltransferase